MQRFIPDKITSEEMAVLDNNAEWLGIPKSHLMECAGYSLAMEVHNRGYIKEKSKVLIICGTGNNGGDGFVIARHLSALGYHILVVLVGSPDRLRTEEAKNNWNIIYENQNYLIETAIIGDSVDLVSLGDRIQKYENFNVIVDGLLGTGIKGKLKEPISSAIDFINDQKSRKVDALKVISIDVPSGLDPNTGKAIDKAVKADLVITFHRLKKGLKKNTKYVKELIVKSIGIPPEASLFVGRGDLIWSLKTRAIDNHKGQFGRVLVLGGSKNYSGAPAYTSLTAIEFGCDLVITYVPEVIGDVLRSYSPNMIVRSCEGDWLTMKAYDEVAFLIDWANTIIIGPGIGLEKQTEEFLLSIIELMNKNKKPYVLDADALKLVAPHLELIKGQEVILTPHEGELKIMVDAVLPVYDSLEERANLVHELAGKMDVTLLVKGPYDYISDGKKLKINRTGVPEMSIGGTGDVLAGLCGCFLTTGNNTFQSASSGAFLNGYLGEYCKKVIGSRFTTVDMIENINNAIIEAQKFRKVIP